MSWVSSLARWIVRHRKTTIAAWVLLVVATIGVSSVVGSKYSDSNSLPGTESQQALDLLQHNFPAQSGDSDQIVVHALAGKVTDPAIRAQVSPMLADVGRMPHVTSVISPYDTGAGQAVSADGTIAFATVLFDSPANSIPKAAVDDVISRAESARSAVLQVELGGQAIEVAQQASLGLATGVGLVAAIVVLVITFGSALAMGLPIITALLGLGTAFGIIALTSWALPMPSVSTELAAMIGLGVGIDYALFIVTRFREDYRRGIGVDEAIVSAMDTAGRAVVFAGATVVMALLGMLALGVTFLTGLAVSATIGVLLTMLASLTVLPALLSRFGERIGRPRRTSRPDRPSIWGRWAGLVTRHPWPAALAGLAVMLVVSLPVVSLRLGVSDAGNAPTSLTTRQAYDLLSKGFGSGFNGPLLIVGQVPDGGGQATLDRVSATLHAANGVASVSPPRVSPQGGTVVWEVFPSSTPQDQATSDLVDQLRTQVLPTLQQQTHATLLVGGVTASGIDFTHVLASKLALFVAIVVVLAALLLLVVFRSIVIPIQAALFNLLTIGASLGVTVAIFQYGWLGGITGVQPGPIEPWLPVMLFAIAFGLSMDYEVFLVSRIHEAWNRRRDSTRAVVDGISSSGRVITAAATIMICVFLSFALNPDRPIKLFGLSLASAVFLDAFVVRSLLLPATLQLLGERTWVLPAVLRQRMPRLAIEPPLEELGLQEGMWHEPELEPALSKAS